MDHYVELIMRYRIIDLFDNINQVYENIEEIEYLEDVIAFEDMIDYDNDNSFFCDWEEE